MIRSMEKMVLLCSLLPDPVPALALWNIISRALDKVMGLTPVGMAGLQAVQAGEGRGRDVQIVGMKSAWMKEKTWLSMSRLKRWVRFRGLSSRISLKSCLNCNLLCLQLFTHTYAFALAKFWLCKHKFWIFFFFSIQVNDFWQKSIPL